MYLRKRSKTGPKSTSYSIKKSGTIETKCNLWLNYLVSFFPFVKCHSQLSAKYKFFSIFTFLHDKYGMSVRSRSTDLMIANVTLHWKRMDVLDDNIWRFASFKSRTSSFEFALIYCSTFAKVKILQNLTKQIWSTVSLSTQWDN